MYDWAADVLNPAFDPKKARERLLEKPQTMICDALLNQDIFAGSGNIVKNEVLFRVKIHPANAIGDIPARKLNALIKETVNFCADFYNWKKENTLTRHLQAYEKEMCPRNHIPFHKADMGKTKRHTYFCPACQVLYK